MAASSDSELKRNKAAGIVIPITAQAAFVFFRPVCLLPHSNPYLPPPAICPYLSDITATRLGAWKYIEGLPGMKPDRPSMSSR